MASLSGENEIRFNKISDIGLRVEGYFNLCEHESGHAGVKVYHAIVEVIDDRGGIAVPVQVLPPGAGQVRSSELLGAGGRQPLLCIPVGGQTHGRELIIARWTTTPRSRSAALMASIASVGGSWLPPRWNVTQA